MKSRYSPPLGRLLTKDSYGYIEHKDPQTLNLYAYCGNNPVNYTDPTGLFVGVDDATEAVFLAACLATLAVASLLGSEAAQEQREAIATRVQASIDKIWAKAETIGGPPGVQYSLRAMFDGYYTDVRMSQGMSQGTVP